MNFARNFLVKYFITTEFTQNVFFNKYFYCFVIKEKKDL